MRGMNALKRGSSGLFASHGGTAHGAWWNSSAFGYAIRLAGGESASTYGQVQGYLARNLRSIHGKVSHLTPSHPKSKVIFELSGFQTFCLPYRINPGDNFSARNCKNTLETMISKNSWPFIPGRVHMLTSDFLLFGELGNQILHVVLIRKDAGI